MNPAPQPLTHTHDSIAFQIHKFGKIEIFRKFQDRTPPRVPYLFFPLIYGPMLGNSDYRSIRARLTEEQAGGAIGRLE